MVADALLPKRALDDGGPSKSGPLNWSEPTGGAMTAMVAVAPVLVSVTTSVPAVVPRTIVAVAAVSDWTAMPEIEAPDTPEIENRVDGVSDSQAVFVPVSVAA